MGLGVLDPTFSEHRLFFISVDRILVRFFNISNMFGAFGSILAALGSLLLSFWLYVGPCWSMWLRFDALKPTLRPTPPPTELVYLFVSIRLEILDCFVIDCSRNVYRVGHRLLTKILTRQRRRRQRRQRRHRKQRRQRRRRRRQRRQQIQYLTKSILMVYPSKQTRTDISGLATKISEPLRIFFATSIMRKHLFNHFRRLILASKIDQQIMFF